MLEIVDAVKVVEVVSKNLDGVSKNTSNFQKLPDTFWGYFAKGHDQKGKFAVIRRGPRSRGGSRCPGAESCLSEEAR